EAAAITVINNFNNVIIPGIGGLGNGYKVKVNVYELSSQTNIEIAHLLLHKPKAAILDNGGNAGIQERVFKFAGLSENDHYSLGLFAADIDPDSCFTFVSEAHAAEGSVSASEVSSIRQFLLDGGNFLAQCAAGRSYEQYAGNRLITQSGVTDPGIGGNIVFDNPTDPAIQIIGGLADEGGSAKSYRPINGYQAGTDIHRHAHDSDDGINHKFYGGKISGAPGLGGNVYYLAGHKYEGQGDIEQDNAYRIYLNALLMPSSRPANCGLSITPSIILYKSGKFNDENGDGCSDQGETISYTFAVSNTGNVNLTNVFITDPLVNVNGGPISLSPGETDSTTFTATYAITQADIDAGEVINQATVYGTANGATISDLSDDVDVLPSGGTSPISGSPQTYTSVQDGNWNNGSTWAGGVPPIDLDSNDVVNINHRVTSNSTTKLSGNAVININDVFVITNGNLEIESTNAVVNINSGLFRIPNGSFLNKEGTVNLNNAAIQLCNDNYTCEANAPNGTFGSGYIYTKNGNIENIGSGTFSLNINWCADDGNGVNMPTQENCSFISLNDCDDELFYLSIITINEDNPTVVDLCQKPIIELNGTDNILCNGDNTGTITVSASRGVTPYEYSLNGGTPQSSPVFNNLQAGNYTVTVIDASGYEDSLIVDLTQPEPISIIITKENATTAQGCTDGEATATASGGTSPYTYLWSASAGSQTTATATNLPEGLHTVTVTDA
ncbi:MAG: hypothetical protein HRU26_03150, partial [Psychroserpens sp.]|nr:hypothetical protein [Psychroserpens sp.]